MPISRSVRLVFPAAAVVGAMCLAAGCMRQGWIYSHTTEPYTESFCQTPVGSKRTVVEDFKVREPVSGYGISAEWGIRAVRDAACAAGMTNIYYADIETLSILSDLFRRRRLIVYGE